MSLPGDVYFAIPHFQVRERESPTQLDDEGVIDRRCSKAESRGCLARGGKKQANSLLRILYLDPLRYLTRRLLYRSYARE